MCMVLMVLEVVLVVLEVFLVVLEVVLVVRMEGPNHPNHPSRCCMRSFGGILASHLRTELTRTCLHTRL